jgi:dephospho-CoA kinase
MRIALTGGIACGKSLLAKYLNELGVETIDADDIVHELIPEDERRRIAAKVFADPQARRELEARIHPLVKARIDEFLAANSGAIAVIPLLFEVHWDSEYDIICTVAASEENQMNRMTAMRGYSRQDAENRLRAQLPVAEKSERSQYTINNNGSLEDLRKETEEFAKWLKMAK